MRAAVRSAVGAMGGGRTAARGSPAGRRTAGRFATFLAGVAGGGIAGGARLVGITAYLGRSADVFLLALADALAPAGALTEDDIAREAMDATLAELHNDLRVGVDGVVAFDRMTSPMMADAVLRYVANYIYARVIHALTAHIHATGASCANIREVERTARLYINDVVRLEVDTSAFFGPGAAAFAARWDGGEGQRVIDRLFEEAYCVVEAGLGRRDQGAA